MCTGMEEPIAKAWANTVMKCYLWNYLTLLIKYGHLGCTILEARCGMTKLQSCGLRQEASLGSTERPEKQTDNYKVLPGIVAHTSILRTQEEWGEGLSVSSKPARPNNETLSQTNKQQKLHNNNKNKPHNSVEASERKVWVLCPARLGKVGFPWAVVLLPHNFLSKPPL